MATLKELELTQTLFIQEAQDAAKATAKEAKDFKVKESAAKEERDTLNAELQQMTKEKTKLEFVIKDLKAWLPDGYSRIFRLYSFGPSGLKNCVSATLFCKI